MIHTDHLLTEFTLGMYDENTMSAVYRMDAEEYADYDKALAAVKEGFFHGKIRTSNPRLYTLLARYVDGSRGLGREVRQDNRQMIADLTRQNALHYIEYLSVDFGPQNRYYIPPVCYQTRLEDGAVLLPQLALKDLSELTDQEIAAYQVDLYLLLLNLKQSFYYDDPAPVYVRAYARIMNWCLGYAAPSRRYFEVARDVYLKKLEEGVYEQKMCNRG